MLLTLRLKPQSPTMVFKTIVSDCGFHFIIKTIVINYGFNMKIIIIIYGF